MAQQVINIGTVAGDGTGDSLRESQRKSNENFSEIYTRYAPNLGVVTPTDTPAGTGINYWECIEAGTYTNFGGVVLGANSRGTIFRNLSGVFSISQVAYDVSGKVNVSDVINTLVSVETTKPLSAAQGKVLDKNKAGVIYEVGKNLFNKNAADVILGQYLNTATTTSASAQYNITGYIPVVAGQSYTMPTKHNMNFYDADKVSILFTTYAESTLTVVAPVGALFYRCTVDVADWETWVFAKGTSLVLNEPYTETKLLETEIIIPKEQVEGLEQKIDFIFIPGENLFNKNATDVTLGRYINALGTTGANAQYNITGFIPAVAGQSYTANAIHSREFYDENKVAIQFILQDVSNLTITAPANTKFLRHTVDVADWNTFTIQLGNAVLPYVAYEETKVLDPLVAVPQTQVLGLEDKIFTKATGKNKFNINGDVSLGKYVGPSGALSSNASYNVTPYMSVVAGQTYTMTARHNIAWYDETFTLVLFEGVIDINDITVIAPINAVYLRCTVPVESWTLFQLENNTFQTAFEAYKEVYVLDNFGVYSSQILNEVDTTTQTKEVNLSMTKNQYLLGGNENNIYFPALLDKSKPNYSVRFPSPFFNFKNFARLTNPATESTGLTVNVYNDDFSVIESKVVDIKIGNPATNNGALNIVAIGDSFTHGGQYLKKVYDACPALNFHGMRTTDSPVSYPFKYEGRGGWTLQHYFNPKLDGYGFSPFAHPTNATYKYYGSTLFWFNVYATPNDYSHQYFEAKRAEIGFSTTTGIKTTPQANDLMYFDKDGSNVYKLYDGSVWNTVSLTNSDFVFNFPKYRSVWNITQPNIVTILLGLNDFRMKNDVTEVNTLFTTWSSQMDSLIASVKADNASAKIAILIPSSYCGSDNNTEGAFNSKLNRMMWEARKLIIAEYDQRDAESIYLVDTGSVIDPDFGFYTNMDTEFNATWVEDTRVPFIGYTDTKKRELDYNTPHPSPDGYVQIGVKVAGFIQKIR